MSILMYRRPRVHRSTRPATIRPVPATFGLGILADAPLSRPRPSSGVSVSVLDSAWRRGYEAGYAGHGGSAPSDYNHREKAAYSDGWQEGRDDDDKAATEAFLAERAGWYAGSGEPWGDEAEYNQGSLVGHAG